MPDLTILPPPTTEIIQAVRAAVGVDEKQTMDAVKCLREWLNCQPHLPHVIDDRKLENIYLHSKGSVERAKQTIDMCYTLRTAIPEFFCDRDPMKPWFREAADVSYFLALPRLTEDYCRVLMGRTVDMDVSKYNVTELIKMIIMTYEIRFLEDYWVCDIIVIDSKDSELGHAAKYTPPFLKKLLICIMKAFNGRIKAVHVLNAPSFAVSVFNLVRTMVKPKLAERIYIHKPGYESLHDFISPKILPLEYGGEAGPIMDLWSAWRKKMESYHEWFIEEDNYKADESKRQGKSLNSSDLFGFEGSFRQLTVD